MIAVKKLKLTIVEEEEKRKEQYKFIRDSQYAQYQGLNLAMGILTSAYLASGRDIKSDLFKDSQKSLTNSNEIFNGINFGKGIDTKSSITQKVKKDFSTSLKNGLAKGERGFTNYKRDFPLMTRGRDLKFYEEDKEFYIKWVNKIVFKILIGRKDKNKVELIHTLNKVLNKEYKVSQSSLQFDKNNKLILNLTIDIPYKQVDEIVKGRVCGVDMGIAIPVYVALNDVSYVREGMGTIDEFMKQRLQFQSRRRRLQQQLKNVNGGKGRKDKLKGLESLREKEKSWVKTYNHALSKRVVEFAKKNKCEYIHLEKLTKDGFGDRLLRNWSYYELQEMIKYKADRVGIKVKHVNPAYTSQTCSECGHVDKENRETQAKFKCLECGFEANADYNAARNIAKSDKFVK
ncbi:TPA: transposase [Clostridioides difficile]|uniref:RNA-guided endonuclease TnpB family protein n=2 Tax=Clostridioides difficile TaxID=1496 RepID=UPI00038DB41C|nr:RNA-guided endonuclease TnpB family protein [Clostridioides difficile]EJA6384761.1 transposase [Clostridioides difficile]EJA6623830.1 transposase [Clostridioides difficile]EJA6666031.1 transposase [Clostridioides difficile]EKG0777669.1 transposase [Clostridioides difficile]EKG0781697.1 transposase [Clostridioides difficile]